MPTIEVSPPLNDKEQDAISVAGGMLFSYAEFRRRSGLKATRVDEFRRQGVLDDALVGVDGRVRSIAFPLVYLADELAFYQSRGLPKAAADRVMREAMWKLPELWAIRCAARQVGCALNLAAFGLRLADGGTEIELVFLTNAGIAFGKLACDALQRGTLERPLVQRIRRLRRMR